MIKDFVNKIKDTKKIANEKNVHNWYNCVFHSMIIIIAGSLLLSLFTMFLYADVDGSTRIGELPLVGIFLPITYSIILSYILLEKLILLHITVYDKLNKAIFNLWQKFDMYWYRKYRKHSPLTEISSKIQSKISKHQSKLSKRNKRLVTIGLIVFIISIQLFWRVPYIIDNLESSENEPEISPEFNYEDQYEEQKRPEIIVRGG